MRWRFIDDDDRAEAQARAAVIDKIDAWWREFAARTDDLEAQFSRGKEWDLPAWMQKHLQAIDDRLMWEYGPAVRGEGHRLIITPESEKQLRPLVNVILQRAPRLPGWEFYPYRLAEDMARAIDTVLARASGYDLAGALVKASIGNHNRVDICFALPHCIGTDDGPALSAAFIASETLLGEEALDKWIGAIEVQPLPKPSLVERLIPGRHKPPSGFVPLDRLKPTVDALFGSIIDQLPRTPSFDRSSLVVRPKGEEPWSLLKLTPDPASDFHFKNDMYVAVTNDEHRWWAKHEGASSFYSVRYSCQGELFCFLKIDGREEDGFPDRSSIEDALEAVLVPARAGSMVGGGTGSRYSYIDLALADVDAAIPLIVACLRAGKITRRTWLLFFDVTLKHEWIGIYPDTPAPPGLNDEAHDESGS